MRLHRVIMELATLLTLFIPSISAHANLISDGSFESPVITPGSYYSFDVGQTFNNWTVIGNPGQTQAVAIVTSTYTEPPYPSYIYTAQDGNQWLDLTGAGANGPNGVQQTISTSIGTTYQLSFWVGNVSGLDRGPTSSVETFIDGVSQGISTNAIPGTTMAWSQFTLDFTATGSSTVIGFLNRDPVTDNVNGLDNVSVVAVPEPETYAMLLAGLGLLGFVGCRRPKR